ncbi:MAG: S-layer homology domain-containing protein [Bryobacterales bacterium]|nr:S-layer homology domain-containing protein [Bryobacterales bacterium]
MALSVSGRIVAALVAGICVWSLPVALAQEPRALLRPSKVAAERLADRAATPGLVIRRARLVQVDRESFLAPADTPRQLQLDLFSDASFTADELRGYWTPDGSTYIWTGRLQGMRRGRIVVAATGDIISANIETDSDGFFTLRQFDGETHVLEQAEARPVRTMSDAVKIPPEERPAPDAEFEAALAAAAAKHPPERLAAGDTQIDVLVAYTARVRTQLGNASAVLNKINLAVAEANQSMVNSGIPIEFRLVHTMETSYSSTDETASNGLSLALSRIRNTSDGYMDDVATARNTYGADLVSLWIHGYGANGGTVGLGYQLQSPTDTFFTSYAYSVVEQAWAPGPGYAFSHELGHNMGAAHDRNNADPGDGAYSYAFGYQWTGTGAFATIMAYDCENVYCPGINYWSNPLVSYQSHATGISSSASNSADNAQALTNIRTVVAAFKPTASGGSCTYTVSPTTISPTSAGTSQSITVTTQSGCAWSASTSNSWITFTNGSGTGSGSFTANIASTTSARTGSISAGGQTISVNQSAPSGGTITVTITSSPTGRTLTVDGSSCTSPCSRSWTSGSSHIIEAATQTASSGNIRYTFTSWSNGGSPSQTVSPSSTTTYTANFSTQYRFNLTANPSAGGTINVSPSSGDGYYAAGSYTFTAAPNSGYQFTNWSGGLGTGTTNPRTITVSASLTAGANFTATTSNVTITLATNPSGLQLTVDGSACTTPCARTWAANSTHTVAAASTQTGTGTRYTFQSWSQGGNASQNLTIGSSTATYTANYATAYQLTTTASPAGGGVVNVSPTSPDGYFAAGTTVQLTAAPNSGYQFLSWSGTQGGSSNPFAFSIGQPSTVIANFNSTAVSITLQTSPSGLPLIVDGQTVQTPYSPPWSAGSTHTVSAPSTTPSGGTRYQFVSWSNGGSQTQTITAGPGTLTATFQTQYLLTRLTSGNGSVTASPTSPDGYYGAGTSVQLTAIPGSGGSQFTGWSGDASGSANPTSVAMSAPRTVTAAFGSVSVCSYTFAPVEASVAASGDIRTVRLNTGSSCSWTALSNASWITILSGGSGTGSGLIRYRVDLNSLTAPRSSSLSAAGATFPITQAPANCTYTLTGPSALLPASTGAYTVSVQTQSGCAWLATSSTPWITFPGSKSATGSGSFTFDAAANTGWIPRPGSVVVAGQTLRYLQRGADSPLFNDSPTSHPFFNYINYLGANNITTGCNGSPTDYCPESLMTRSEMAAFIVRSLLGENFSYNTVPYFADVPASHASFRYIQKLRDLGVTNGCTASTYCPDATVTRGQMAAFLVRALLGISATETFPYPSTAFFTDIPGSHPFYAYIQKLRELGITAGCTATTYCSEDGNTRGQMAVFVTRGFSQ